MKKAIAMLLCVAVFALPLSGCYYLKHTVGAGAAGNNQVAAKQWYVLWGLIPLGEVNSQQMAGGANNYTVESGVSFVDWLINVLCNAIIPTTVAVQTVTVTK